MKAEVTYNISRSGDVPASPLYVFLYACAAGVVLLTVCGNLLVIISISHFKQLHTPTNFFILSLAVADFFIGLMVMPFSFSKFIETRWLFGSGFCTISSVTGFYLTGVSIYNVLFIAIDRFLVLCDPFFYSSKITVNVTLCIIFSVWLLCFIYNTVLVLFNKNAMHITMPVVDNESAEVNVHFPVECSTKMNEASALVDLVIVFIVPCCTMIFLYIKIFSIVSTHVNAIKCSLKQPYSVDLRKTKLSMASERKAAKTLGILVAVFVLCLVPSCVCPLLDPSGLSPFLYTMLNMISNWFLLLNSLINPIIYAFFYPWFWKCTKDIITCKMCASDSLPKNRVELHFAA